MTEQTPSSLPNLSRRGFMQGTAAVAGAALLVGFDPSGVLAAGHEKLVANPFVRIDKDGIVTVIIKHFEMGQGTTTGLTTLAAEEMDADWDAVKPEFAPADKGKYANLYFGSQGTGGSTAMANSFMQYREAGAAARDLMVRAAAKKFGVSADDITISKGVASAGDKRAHFGELVDIAADLTPPEKPILKSPDQFTLIGKIDLPRKDARGKVNGTATFAMDIQLAGMVTVAIKRPPRFGAKLTTYNADAAKEVPGFINAKMLPNAAGVAVYAKDTWAAFQARDAVTAEWDSSEAERRSTPEMMAAIESLTDAPTYDTRAAQTPLSRATAAVKGAAKMVEADFHLPFLAHAPMEPLVCVIEGTDTGVRFHDGCQFPTLVQGNVSHVLGLTPEQVEVNTVYAGGSFGRRATPLADYQVEAAMAFDMMGRDKPIKLVWSREDDIKGGYYRPMAYHKASIGLDDDGKIVGWDHRIAAKSILKGSPFESFMVKDGVDHVSVEGTSDTLYQIPNLGVGLSDFETVVPVLWWRAVGHTHTAFAMESLMDMAAEAAGQDPVAFRLSLLDESDQKQKRFADVIRTARDMAGWSEGDKRGFASHFSFNSYVAMVADVSVNGDEAHVNKVHIAVDCGIAINPDVIKAQMQGGMGYGLGAAMRDQITLDKGVVEQSNFPNYELLRFTDMPEVEVQIVTSDQPPTGVGEPGTPPTAPAVANALYAQTGKRFTRLPLSSDDLTFV